MSSEFASELLMLIVAMSVSMALIPLLIRFAPVLGMMDEPDPRKVHAVPVPRVGGVGIVLGALIPMLVWLPWNDLILSYLVGSVVLLLFGVWDDIKELGHYAKFIGQFIAVLAVVYYGDLYVTHLPLMGLEPVGETVGRLFTVVAMIGVINAINHSDGLDGLAGGESLLSLGAIAYLASQAGDVVIPLIALATIGGVFGFLRFNSHPARVFMGDGGSQFLGFTLAFLVVYLTQISNPALSPALPALLLGLPVVDILAVFVQRAYGGMNWFRATKNHVHHRLLELGFHHYESVMVIYSVQALLVISGVLMPYESDALILAIYLLASFLLFAFLIVAERRSWRAHVGRNGASIDGLAWVMRMNKALIVFDHVLIQVLISLFLLGGMLTTADVPWDLSVAAVLLFTLLAFRLFLGYRVWFLFLRLILFVTVAFSAYLLEFYPPVGWADFNVAYNVFFGVIALAVVLAVRFSEQGFFQVTPLDYLVLLIVAVLATMSETGHADISAIRVVLQLIVMFYGVEVVIKHMRNRINLVTVSSLVFLGGVAVRGIF